MASEGKKSARIKGSKGGRFNFVDLLIILALLLFIAIVVNIFLPSSFFSSFKKNTEREIQYTVEFSYVDQDFVDKIKENNQVIDSVSKYSLGNVITVDYNQNYSELYYDTVQKAGGLLTYEDKYNVIVTVTVMAQYDEGEGYSVGDRRIAVGEKLSLRFPDYVAEGYCIGLSEAE
jgi:hypothetical protein